MPNDEQPTFDLAKWISSFSDPGEFVHTRNDGIGHFDLEYPFAAFADLHDQLKVWRERQLAVIREMKAPDYESHPADDFAHECQTHAYMEAATTQALLAMVVPVVDSLLKQFVAVKLRQHYQAGRLRAMAGAKRLVGIPASDEFWDISNHWDSETQAWVVGGMLQEFFNVFEKTLELPTPIQPRDRRILEALFYIRNRSFHEGLHWSQESLNKLHQKIEGGWSEFFTGMTNTLDGKTTLLLPYLTEEFENELLPWLREFATFLGNVDLDLLKRESGATG